MRGMSVHDVDDTFDSRHREVDRESSILGLCLEDIHK